MFWSLQGGLIGVGRAGGSLRITEKGTGSIQGVMQWDYKGAERITNVMLFEVPYIITMR